MGLFSKKKMRYTDPLAGTGMEWMRPAISEELKGLPGRAGAVSEQMKGLAEPTIGRFSQILQEGGPQWGAQEQAAIGGYGRMLEATPGEFLGGYDPEAARTAITQRFAAEIPQRMQQFLSSGPLGGTGVHHGRGILGATQLAQTGLAQESEALAAENVRRAQLQAGAEQFAAGQRQVGAGGLAGFKASDLLQREMAMQQFMQGLAQSPEMARQQLMQRLFAFDPRTFAFQPYMKEEKGMLEQVGGALGGLGSVAQGLGGLGGFSDLFGGGGGIPTQAGQGYAPQWQQQWSTTPSFR